MGLRLERQREQTQAQINISRQQNHVTTGRRTKQARISVISGFRDVSQPNPGREGGYLEDVNKLAHLLKLLSLKGVKDTRNKMSHS